MISDDEIFEWVRQNDAKVCPSEALSDEDALPAADCAATLSESNPFAHLPRLPQSADTTPDKLAVRVDDLWIRYGKFAAVRGISLQIPPGEVFGFIGPNGAGKSSTIRVLATLQNRFTGRVQIDGHDVHKSPHLVREKIGYVPDFFGVYDDLTVREYLHFFAAAYRLPYVKRYAVVDDVLQLTDLTQKIDAPVEALSRGMKQRLSLARVLLHDPAVLLLDEPASGLDPRARIEMRELLKALKEMGKTIVISSHILHELAQLCTQIGIIEAGKIVAHGSVAEIYRQLGLLRIVHVQLASEANGIVEKLRTLPGVTRVDEAVDRLSIRFEEGSLEAEDIHDFLVQHGVRLRMFQAEVMDMETAFMKLTEGQTQ